MNKVKLITLLLLIINDVLFIIGATFINVAAYRWNINAGLVLTGVFFMFYAFLLSKKGGD